MAATANLRTCELLESGNTLILKEADMDDQLSPGRLDQARIIYEQTKDLDHFIQEIMTDILVATHEDNSKAIADDGSIDLSKAGCMIPLIRRR